MHTQSRYDAHAAAEAAEFLNGYLPSQAQTAVITGTGLGAASSGMRIEHTIDYQSIPSFPVSTVISHSGTMQLGALAEWPVAAMQGRFHLYEGYSPEAVTFPIRVFQAMGIKTVILVSAAGGLNPGFHAGDIMIVEDHINLTGKNPLIGPNDDAWGPRFPDMIHAYPAQLHDLAFSAAQTHHSPIRKGVYAGLIGPVLETPAEIRYLQTIGADAVGFSMVMETMAAVHAGIQVLGLCAITNVCDADTPQPAVVDEILSVAESTAPRIADIIADVILHLGDEGLE